MLQLVFCPFLKSTRARILMCTRVLAPGFTLLAQHRASSQILFGTATPDTQPEFEGGLLKCGRHGLPLPIWSPSCGARTSLSCPQKQPWESCVCSLLTESVSKKVRLGATWLFHKSFLLPILTVKRKLLHIHISIRNHILCPLGGGWKYWSKYTGDFLHSYILCGRGVTFIKPWW